MTTCVSQQQCPPRRLSVFWLLFLAGLFGLCARSEAADESQIELNTDDYQSSCGIEVTQDASLIQVTWLLDSGRRGRLTFDLTRNRPLIHTAAVSSEDSASFRPIAKGLDPMVQVRIGDRDLEKRGSWTVFFRPHAEEAK